MPKPRFQPRSSCFGKAKWCVNFCPILCFFLLPLKTTQLPDHRKSSIYHKPQDRFWPFFSFCSREELQPSSALCCSSTRVDWDAGWLFSVNDLCSLSAWCAHILAQWARSIATQHFRRKLCIPSGGTQIHFSPCHQSWFFFFYPIILLGAGWKSQWRAKYNKERFDLP